MPSYSTISVIYVIEDAVFFDKRIRYLKACAVENVSKFHFFTGIITPVVFRLLDVNEIQLHETAVKFAPFLLSVKHLNGRGSFRC